MIRRNEPTQKRMVRLVRRGEVCVNGIWRKIKEPEPAQELSKKSQQTEEPTMPMDPYCLKTLDKIDPLKQEFDRLRQAAITDCQERPGVDKPRVVKIEFKFVPADDGDQVFVEHVVTSKLPNRAIPTYKMLATANGGAKFQPGCPYDPTQESFDFGEE